MNKSQPPSAVALIQYLSPHFRLTVFDRQGANSFPTLVFSTDMNLEAVTRLVNEATALLASLKTPDGPSN